MRVLLVCTNRESNPYPVSPLGALFVAQAARQAGHRVEVLDLAFSRRPRHALLRAVRRTAPDAVAFSIRNHDNCYYLHPQSYVETNRALAAVVRRHSRAPLILGGSGFSMAPRKWLERLDAHYGIVGEGEVAFPRLLDCLAAGATPQPQPGLLARGAARSESANVESRNRVPPASRPTVIGRPSHEDCRYERYLAAGGFIGTQTKRGCPFGCVYCVYPQLEGASFRLREPEDVAEELRIVRHDGKGRYFFLTDSVFNAPRDHALAVCERLAAGGVDARWMALCNPVGFDRELAAAMRRAGCIGIEFGLDAVTDKMLARLGKPFDRAQIESALAAAAAADLPFAVHLLFGGPGETLDDLDRTQSFLDGCAAPRGVFASIGIRVHAGTPLEAIARAEGRIDPDDDLCEPVFYVSEGLGARPLQAIDRLARAREHWSSPLDWETWTMRVIRRVINRVGARPQWLHVRNYGRYLRRGGGG
jgi:radical SAM superfamily enzyme YgiQ (UPF0313 family)